MSYKRFPSPVRVKLSDSSLIIENAWDAVEYLRAWPTLHCPAYRIALQHCMDALDGLRSPRKAAQSFIIAARQAGLLV